MSYQWMIGLVMRLFSCGPTFEDHPQVFSQKGPAPWILFLTPAPLPLEVTFLVGEGEHMWLYPLCKSHLKNHTHSINHGTFFPGV